MAVIIEQLKQSHKKDSRSSKNKNKNNTNNNNQQQKLCKASVLEAIAKGGKVTSYTAEDGSIRMKILVKKQDLKQILGSTKSNTNNVVVRDGPKANSVPQSTSSSIERRLFELMRKKKVKSSHQANKGGNNLSSWRPNLQSIPEEH